MTEYIERDKLLEVIKQAIFVYENANILNTEAIRDGLKPLLDTIVDVPASDVKEITHAHIVETVENGRFKRVCSNCNSDITTLTQLTMPNYCIKCVAKMDL